MVVHIISDEMTGADIECHLRRQVYEDWERENSVSFTVGRRTKVNIQMRPTPNQPGNGLVTFRNGRRHPIKPTWDDLKYFLEEADFRRYYNDFFDTEMSVLAQGNVTRDGYFKTCFLLVFEVARRIENDPYCPNQDQTKEAIDIAVAEGQYDDLIDMFTLSAREGDFSRRWEAFERVMTLERRDDDDDSLEDEFGALALY